MSARDSDGSGRTKAANRGEASFGAFVRKPVERAAPAAAGSGAAEMRAESAESWPDDAVEVGAIVDAYGLKGWVKVAAHADAGRGGDALLSAKRWWLMKGRERRSAPVLQSKIHSDSIVAHLGGTTDRDVALSLRGHSVYVRRSDFPALEADEFYWVDLLGLDVVNEAGVARQSSRHDRQRCAFGTAHRVPDYRERRPAGYRRASDSVCRRLRQNGGSGGEEDCRRLGS